MPKMLSRTWLNVAIYLGTTALTSVLGLLTAMFMARMLTPEQYGRIGIFLSMLYIAAPMVSLSAEGLIAVNRSILDDEEYEHFRSTALAIGFSVFVLLQTVGLILWASDILRDGIMLVLPGYALLRLATNIASTEYIVEQKANTYAILALLNSILAMALTYGLLAWLSASAGSRVVSLMAAESVLLVGRYRGRMKLLLRPKFHGKYVRQIVTFGLPSLLALFGAWGLNESDKVVVAHGAGLAVAGLYTAAATLATVMTSINQSLTNALFPGLFMRLSARTVSIHALMAQYVLKFLASNGIFAVIMMVGYCIIKDSLLPKRYAEASTYFYALVLASLAIAVFRPISLICDFFKLARSRAIAIIAGGASTIICATAGIRFTRSPLWAPVGIGLGYMVASIITGIRIFRLGFDE